MPEQRAVLFCNGLRQRMLEESGGLAALSEVFDCFIDTSAFSKPWEHRQSYGDRVSLENSVALQSIEEAEAFFANTRFSYVLFVGLEWSEERDALVRCVARNVQNWGILFVRGDMRDLFRGRKYDHRWLWRWKKWRRAFWQAAPEATATHYFSNELSATDFREIGKDTQIIAVNHIDSHFADQAVPEEAETGIVFLDQALTYTYADSEANVFVERFFDTAKAERHFEHLNAYLRHLAAVTDQPVTICLHPNWPENRPVLYDPDFRITRKRTVPCLMRASMAITHSSMATGFCHMLRIPTALLTLPEEVLPGYVRREIAKKSRNERLPVHQWPSTKHLNVQVPRADNARIRQFLMPDETHRDLGAVLRQYVTNSAGDVPLEDSK